MAYVDREGVRIFYESRGSGPALLLTPGYGGTSRTWTAQVEALRGRARVIVWDVRGHGRSDSPEPPSAYSEAATLADMAAILDACGIERAAIGGLSLGGYLSLAFCLAHPSRVRALLLFDTGPGFRKPEARDAWNAQAEQMATALEREGLQSLGPGSEVRASEHRSARGLALAARGILALRDARVIDSLPEIDVPTLVLVGEMDKPFLGAADYMAAKIPGARRVVIAGAGHAANVDQPVAFNAAVISFLESAGILSSSEQERGPS